MTTYVLLEISNLHHQNIPRSKFKINKLWLDILYLYIKHDWRNSVKLYNKMKIQYQNSEPKRIKCTEFHAKIRQFLTRVKRIVKVNKLAHLFWAHPSRSWYHVAACFPHIIQMLMVEHILATIIVQCLTLKCFSHSYSGYYHVK